MKYNQIRRALGELSAKSSALSWLRQRLPLVFIIVAFAGIGTFFLIDSHADTPSASINADNGTVDGCATVQSDSSASDGKDVMFNSCDADLTASPITIPASVSASQAQLGFNMGASFTNPTAMAAMKAIGATIARWQPGWGNVENYSTGDLSLGSATEAALAYSGQNGIQPLAVCAYGPPYSNVFDLTVGSGGAKTGDYTIPINGSVASIDMPLDYVMLKGNAQLTATGKWGYYGALIASVDTSSNTITLASALTTNLPAGTQLVVNRLRYDSPADQSQTNPSLLAYFRYCGFVADRIAANSATGWVSIWNEPAWAHDPWDARGKFYDTVPSGMNDDSRMKMFLQYALTVNNLPNGVKMINGATDKTGSNSILSQQGLSPTTATVANNIDVESIHPYGNLPDEGMWDPEEVNSAGNAYVNLNPTVDAGGNFNPMAFRDSKANIGLSVMATEVGTDYSDDKRQAVWLTRRVATSWGSNVIPVLYEFDNADGSNFGVWNSKTDTPRLAYYSLQRMMSLVKDVGGSGGSVSSTPSFVGYSAGQWPPYATSIYGKEGTLLLVWQRTGYNTTTEWDTIPTPATYSAEFNLPSGDQVVSATDLITGDSVPTSVSGNQLTLGAVGEDVQAILIKP
jgi:hypothetical protein